MNFEQRTNLLLAASHTVAAAHKAAEDNIDFQRHGDFADLRKRIGELRAAVEDICNAALADAN